MGRIFLSKSPHEHSRCPSAYLMQKLHIYSSQVVQRIGWSSKSMDEKGVEQPEQHFVRQHLMGVTSTTPTHNPVWLLQPSELSSKEINKVSATIRRSGAHPVQRPTLRDCQKPLSLADMARSPVRMERENLLRSGAAEAPC